VASPSRILVTGAAGFTGRHLCAALAARGHAVLRMVERATGVADEVVADCLRRLKATQADVKFLGSYPAAGHHGEALRREADAAAPARAGAGTHP